MTPDEMKVLARVANRNAHEESPIVVDRAIQQIVDQNEIQEDLDLSLASLDQRLDILENESVSNVNKINGLLNDLTSLGQAVSANETPLGVLTQAVAKSNVALANLSAAVANIASTTLQDALKLKPADVIIDVIKPRKMGSMDVNQHALFSDIGSASGMVGKSIKINKLKQLSARPNNIIDIESSYGGTSEVLLPIGTGARNIDGDIVITSNANIIDVDLSDRRFAELQKVKVDSASSIKSLTGIIDIANGYNAAKSVAVRDSSAFYESTPSAGAASGYYFKVSGSYYDLWKHTQNATDFLLTSNTEFTSTAVAAGDKIEVLFNTGHLIKFQYSNNKYTAIAKVPLQADKNYLINRLDSVGGMAVMHATVAGSGTSVLGFSKANIIKPATDSLYKYADKLYSMTTSGSTGLVSTDTYFSQSINGLNKLCWADTGANITVIDDNSFLYDEENDILFKNSPNANYELAPNGYFIYDDAADNKLFKVLNGAIVYDAPADSTIAYKFKPDAGTTTVKVVTCVVPAVNSQTIFLNRIAITTQSSLSGTEKYIDSNFILRDKDDKVVTTYNGLYLVSGAVNIKKANKLYTVDSNGLCTLYSGLAYLSVSRASNANELRIFVNANSTGITPLSNGSYIDSNGRIFKVGNSAPSAWVDGDFVTNAFSVAEASRTEDAKLRLAYAKLVGVTPSVNMTASEIIGKGGIEIVADVASTFSNKFVRIIHDSSFELAATDVYNRIARKEVQHELLQAGAVVKVNGIIFSLNADMIMTKLVNAYVFTGVDNNGLQYIDKNGSLTSLDSECRHYSWPVDSMNVVYYNTGSGNMEYTGSNPSYAYESQTTAVLLVNVPVNDNLPIDEEGFDSSDSSRNMYLLNKLDGTFAKFNDGRFRISADKFVASDFTSLSVQDVYWIINSVRNEPLSNVIVEFGSGKFLTNNWGQRDATAMTLSNTFVVTPNNNLEKFLTNSSTVNDPDVYNKYYIDYEGRLCKSGLNSGTKDREIMGLNFVVFDNTLVNDDSRPRLYNDARLVIVPEGTIICVSSSAPANSAEHAYNGLKLWGKDTTGMFNRWISMVADVARQSNIKVGEQVDVFNYTDANARSIDFRSIVETTETTNTVVAPVVSIVGSGLNGSGDDANKPTASANSGKYYLSTDSANNNSGAALGKLYSSNGTVWSAAASVKFIMGDRLYETDGSGFATPYYGVTLQALDFADATTAPSATGSGQYYIDISGTTPILKVSSAAGTGSWGAHDGATTAKYVKLSSDGKLYKVSTADGKLVLSEVLVGRRVRMPSDSWAVRKEFKKILSMPYGVISNGVGAFGPALTALEAADITIDTKVYMAQNLVQEFLTSRVELTTAQESATAVNTTAGTAVGQYKLDLTDGKLYKSGPAPGYTFSADTTGTGYLVRANGKLFDVSGLGLVTPHTGVTIQALDFVDAATAPSATGSGQYYIDISGTTPILKVSSAAGTGSWGAHDGSATAKYVVLKSDKKVYKVKTADGALSSDFDHDDIGRGVVLSSGVAKKISALGNGNYQGSTIANYVGASLEDMASTEIRYNVKSATGELYKGGKKIDAIGVPLIAITYYAGKPGNAKLIGIAGTLSNATVTTDTTVIQLADASIKKAGTVGSSPLIDTWNATVQPEYQLDNNETALLLLDQTITSLRQRDGSVYYVNQKATPADNHVLVIDGMVQDARAPKGTKIYTTGGIFIRTGYSKAQADAASAAGRPALVAADTWISM